MHMNTNGNIKKILIKDLCSRLPYGVKIDIRFSDEHGSSLRSRICGEGLSTLNVDELWLFQQHEIEVKPYLFPMESMTDEMLEELNANGFFKYRDTIANVSHMESNGKVSEEIYTYIDIENISFLMEFFYSHHIDFRGLIDEGLALDATGLNIY